METKVEIELAVQVWYGRVMKEADTPTGLRAQPKCDSGHRMARGEDYVVLVRPGGKQGATLCIKNCGERIVDHFRYLAEGSGKLGTPSKAGRQTKPSSGAGRRPPANGE